MTIQLGDKVKCKITGFTGIVTGKAEYISGCVRFNVEAKERSNKDGKIIEYWIDEQRLERVSAGINLKKKQPTGGPRSAPTGQSNPTW